LGSYYFMTESFAELFEQSIANQSFNNGEIIIGNVVDIQDDFVVVHAGLKSEAVIPIAQFKNAAGELEVSVGDDVEVALDHLKTVLVKHVYHAKKLSVLVLGKFLNMPLKRAKKLRV